MMPEKVNPRPNHAPSVSSPREPSGHIARVLLFAASGFAVLGFMVGSLRFGLMMALILLTVSFATYIAERRGDGRTRSSR